MNVVTIQIQVDSIDSQQTHLHAHIAHPAPFWHQLVPKRGVGERTWRGTYQGSALRASFGGIWLALRELDQQRLYKCVVNLKCPAVAATAINNFLWQSPAPDNEDVYEYLRPLLRKHTILQRNGLKCIESEELINEIQHFWGHHHLRTRLPRAAQLVAIGAVQEETPLLGGYWDQNTVWEVFSQTIPNGNPYLVKPVEEQGRTTSQCNCLDSSPVCKHILAVNMQCNILLIKQGE